MLLYEYLEGSLANAPSFRAIMLYWGDRKVMALYIFPGTGHKRPTSKQVMAPLLLPCPAEAYCSPCASMSRPVGGPHSWKSLPLPLDSTWGLQYDLEHWPWSLWTVTVRSF